MKYDIFKHGPGTKVYHVPTGRVGIVKEIHETAYEWIEPFVDFGDDKLEKVSDYSNLKVMQNDTTDHNPQG